MTSISQNWEQVAEPPHRSIKNTHWGNVFRAVRAQTPNFDDPLLNDYLEHQIYRLASYSDLEDFRLYIVMINNPTINAFAALEEFSGFITVYFSPQPRFTNSRRS